MTENFYGITDKGKRRDKNEDTFIAQEVFKKQYIAACVIDGVGGYSGGEIAAGIARSVLLEHFKKHPHAVMGMLQEAIVDANERIYAEKQSGKNESMACVLTCALADIKNNTFYYAHVGDTRLYLLRDNTLVKITKDHSVVGFLEESGRLSEEDAMRHPRRNEINKALGFEARISTTGDFIETGESPFLPGDTILLCSDGLTDMIGSSSITAILAKKTSLAIKGKELIDAANDAGGKDNITAVLVENTKERRSLVASQPVEKKNEVSEKKAVINQHENQQTIIPKSNNALIAFLTILCSGLSFALLFTLFKNKGIADHVIVQQPVQPHVKNLGETVFQNAISDSLKMYALSPAGITLSDSIVIKKDTFHLLGNGKILKSDSGYKGPAFIIHPASTYILFDSLVFENFDVGIIAHRNNLILKNVKFINCRVPVQYNLLLKDTTISGRLKDSILSITVN
ncbi:MAG: protein phosphatase 2C domain-containing protein [Ferruginibacter sp.]